MKKITQEESKQHNSRLVLRTIYEQGEISRVDISRRTGLTRTTVSEMVSRLMQENLVVETGVSPSRGGKRAILLRLDGDARHLLAIDLANSEFSGAIVNLRGQICERESLGIQEPDGEAALAMVYRLIEKLLEKASRPVLGIGIGAPGLIDPQKGIVRQAVNLDWHELPLGKLLQERFNLPVYIANDSQAAALGEFTFEKSGPSDSLVVIKVGRGISAGIVLGGKLYHGDQAGAGEIGHIRVADNGERCRCGNTGCLETVLSTRALVRRARQIACDEPGSALNRLSPSPDEITTETFLQAFQEGDPSVMALVAQAADYLASAVMYLAGTMNINHIVIAGSLARLGEDLAGPVRERVRNGILPALANDMKVEISPLGSDIVILGAASLLLSGELGLV